MNRPVMPECYLCKHFVNWEQCAAFPDGIPRDIALRGVSHRKPYPGDGGIQFEVAPGKEDELRAREQRMGDSGDE